MRTFCVVLLPGSAWAEKSRYFAVVYGEVESAKRGLLGTRVRVLEPLDVDHAVHLYVTAQRKVPGSRIALPLLPDCLAVGV